jgi:hypothetical protein
MAAVGENMIDHLQLRCTYETTLPHDQRRDAQPGTAGRSGCSTC